MSVYEPRNIDRMIIHSIYKPDPQLEGLENYWDSLHNNQEGRSIVT